MVEIKEPDALKSIILFLDINRIDIIQLHSYLILIFKIFTFDICNLIVK